ncbi:DUF262 domain-containing protein [Flavobacterium solisilvae]|uniref:DUF262 domain-containing protein n=1 Tax=Flavobacterium solisilvae TaxID=1852019 RepID=A0ABX1QVV6_9FLAO|nr:DUF262 domain-containing protein [Flavobacterium solisilvae]NMH26406.1 DUF262 domain-containing protein [Flavobacterium solisilvae]
MIESKIINNNLPIKSNLVCLEDIVKNNLLFNIPIYQRLYVWGSDQISTLLEDLWRASTKEEDYYLGGIMIAKNNNKYDLIDGQQRFTTLWLIGNVLKNELSNFVYQVSKDNKQKRVSFAIRDFANHYFDNPNEFTKFSKEEKGQLKGVKDAESEINDFLKDKTEDEKKDFSNFIYNQVRFIITEMPPEIDENRLFEVLNNRGVQLQHHEILKAKMLEFIDDEDKNKYAKIWDACAIMDEYFEKNIKELSGLKWRDLTLKEIDVDKENIDAKEVGLTIDIINRVNNSELTFENIHLLEILNDKLIEIKKDDDEIKYDSGKVRSIISFPMLLLHVLRIFVYDNEEDSENIVEINEKKLIEIFESFFEEYSNKKDVENFILLLLEIRIKFDKFVIKWVEKDNEEHHLIKRLYLNKNTLQRRELIKNEGFALLQSMLYHSQQIITHYWLTPFLYKMRSTDSYEELYNYLKKLDNQMFCSEYKGDLKSRSWKLIDNDLKTFKPKIEVLEKAEGTNYWSYWFYKLEFILWHELSDKKGVEWQNYRMTKKNSVEHISPQNPQNYDTNKVFDPIDSDEVRKTKLDDFGNLVLLSVGMNSEYSNKTFKEKKTTFHEKKRLDSLKSAIIFDNETWNWKLCEKHRIEMISIFQKYLIKTM